MDTVVGAGAATLSFNTPGQNAYWYTDLSYPTGADDASIAAGNYTLDMYFNSLPGAAAGFPQVAATAVGTSGNVKTSQNSSRIPGAEAPTIQPPESAGVGGNSISPNPPLLTPTGGAKDYLWIAVETNNQTGTPNPITAFPRSYSGGIQANGDTPNTTNGPAHRPPH